MTTSGTASLAPEIIAKARQDYLDGRRVSDICKEYGLTQFTLYVWIDGGPASAPQKLPPLPRRTDSKATQPHKLTGSRTAVVKRLWRTAERQVRDIESRLIAAGQEPAERERDARIMAVLVKTLGELSALDERKDKSRGKQGARPPKAAEPHGHASDDEPAVGIDEFRRELARRLAALADDEEAATGGESAGAAG